MDNIPVELQAILDEIETAIVSKLYYLAVAVALSVPDICACLEQDQDEPQSRSGVRARYSRWCDSNLSFEHLSGNDLYYIRCGVAHSGHVYKNNSIFDRVMFTVEGSPFRAPQGAVINMETGTTLGGMAVDDLRLSGKLLLHDVGSFCRTIINAARAWAISKRNDPIVQRNLPMLIRYRPEGLPPFMVGAPIIA